MTDCKFNTNPPLLKTPLWHLFETSLTSGDQVVREAVKVVSFHKKQLGCLPVSFGEGGGVEALKSITDFGLFQGAGKSLPPVSSH